MKINCNVKTCYFNNGNGICHYAEWAKMMNEPFGNIIIDDKGICAMKNTHYCKQTKLNLWATGDVVYEIRKE